MGPQDFIESRLSQLSEPASIASSADLESRIYAALMSKKFRKYSCTEKQQNGIRNAIKMAVEKQEPIKFGFPFGAYKLWRFEEAPEADWAELFTLMYYSRWLKPVADMYTPGIAFDFSSDEAVIEKMNNISKAETARYAETLQSLFNFIGRFTPKNVRFSLMPIGSLYENAEEFDADLSGRVDALMASNNGRYRELDSEDIASIELNVRPTPGQLDDPEWREKVDVIHHAYYTVKKRRPYLAAFDRIAAFPTPLPNYNCIAVGTTKTSIAKFWVGVGALKRKDESFIETVLSPSQLSHARFEWAPVNLKRLEGKNFNRIRILDK